MKRHAAVFATVFLPLTAFAQLIAGWDAAGVDLDDFSAPYTLPAHACAAKVAAAALSLSANVGPSVAADSYGFRIQNDARTDSLAAAIVAGHYMEFVVVAADDCEMNLSSLTVRGGSTQTGCDSVAILSGVDGFTDDKAIASVTGIAGKTGGFDTAQGGFGGPIDLRHAKYSGLKAITFRIYGWNSSGTTGVTSIRNLTEGGIYDLVVYGTVQSVPRRGTMMVIR